MVGIVTLFGLTPSLKHSMKLVLPTVESPSMMILTLCSATNEVSINFCCLMIFNIGKITESINDLMII